MASDGSTKIWTPDGKRLIDDLGRKKLYTGYPQRCSCLYCDDCNWCGSGPNNPHICYIDATITGFELSGGDVCIPDTSPCQGACAACVSRQGTINGSYVLTKTFSADCNFGTSIRPSPVHVYGLTSNIGTLCDGTRCILASDPNPLTQYQTVQEFALQINVGYLGGNLWYAEVQAVLESSVFYSYGCGTTVPWPNPVHLNGNQAGGPCIDTLSVFMTGFCGQEATIDCTMHYDSEIPCDVMDANQWWNYWR